MTLERLPQYDAFAIPGEQIYVDHSFNCRDEFELKKARSLAESIDEHGLQFPVIVAPREGPIPYRLVAGFRRRAACIDVLHWPTIPASVREGLTEEQLRILNFAENLEREDLTIVEEAKAIAKMLRTNISIRSLAAQIKREQRWIRVRLRLLQFPRAVQDLAVDCRFGETALEIIWQQKTPQAQIKAAHALAEARRAGAKNYHEVAGLTHSFSRRRTKEMMRQMAARMLEAGLEGVGPRACAWAAGEISDDELWGDVMKALVIQQLARGQHVNQQTESTDASDP